MTRKVFFSFQFKNDIFRVNQVRKINQFQETNEFHDHATHEKIMCESDVKIKRWIDNQLNGASVTCVLIGSNTSQSKWVRYEIRRSIEMKKGILGIYIHNIKDKYGMVSPKGNNPFDDLKVGGILLSKTCKVYNPFADAYNFIRNNISQWIEDAAKKVGR